MKIAFLWFMTPCSLVFRHQNLGKMRCLNLNPKTHGQFLMMIEAARSQGRSFCQNGVHPPLQPSPYTVPPLLLRAAPLTLKGICSWVCLKPLLAARSSYWMHNNTWATSGSELLSSNWSLIVFRNPFTINLKAF